MSSVSSSDPPAVKPFLRWELLDGLVLWFLAYRGPQYFISELSQFLMPVLPQSGNLRNALIYLVIELMTIGLVVLFLRLYRLSLTDVGVGKWQLSFIPKVIVGYFAYFALTFLFSLAARWLGINLDESQDLGFDNLQTYELLLSFAVLVLIVPFAEELLFRGFLFRVLRTKFGFNLTAVVVSVLFGLVHGQVGVGIDVFALSLILCHLRETTGSLWPAVMLHSLKNAIAFLIVFVL